MHILIIPTTYPTILSPQSGNFVRNQAAALSSQGIEIGVFGVFSISLRQFFKFRNIFKIGVYNYLKNNLVEFYCLLPVIPKLSSTNNYLKYLISRKLIKSYFEKYGLPSLIHLHGFEMGKLAIFIKKKYKINFLVTEHSSMFNRDIALKWHKRMANLVFNNSSFNIAVSNEFSKDLSARFDADFHFLPNFVNVLKFKTKFTNNTQKKKFINIAYLNKNKNQKLLIDSFYKAFLDNPNFELIIVGNGPEKINLQNQLKINRINNIKLYGYAHEDEIVNLLRTSDFFVLSSTFETFGLVLIEAMSCGLPVISTRCGGPESIIRNENLGILCDNNLESLSSALKQIVNMNYNSNYIRDFAIKNFSYENLSRKLIELYKRIIEKNYEKN